jgi:hypothetical protein
MTVYDSVQLKSRYKSEKKPLGILSPCSKTKPSMMKQIKMTPLSRKPTQHERLQISNGHIDEILRQTS